MAPGFHREYIREIVEKTEKGSLELILKEIQQELKELKSKQGNERAMSQNQLDFSHSKLDEGRTREQCLELKLQND